MSTNTIISLRPQNVIRRIPWRVGSRSALGFILIMAVFSLVGWLYLTDASRITATSYQIDELRLALEHVENQNAALILEISELKALSRVEKRAFELGFRPVDELEYLKIENFPAPTKAEDNRLFSFDSEDYTLNSYAQSIEQPSWWVEKLDRIAAWLEGRDTSNYVRDLE